MTWLISRPRRGRPTWGSVFDRARDAAWSFVVGLRLPSYFKLGLLGYAGTLMVLAVPSTVMALGRRWPGLSLLGALLLALVAPILPFAQARYAAEGRFAALFELRIAQRRFGRAPWAFALALVLTMVLAAPLYLLKIEMIPRETVWLPSLVFLGFIFPARLATGWALARSTRRTRPRHWLARLLGRLLVWPSVALYIVFVFLSQYTAWFGIGNLYEQHAFLLPAPFLGR